MQPADPQSQVGANLGSDIFLQREDVVHFSRVTLAPQQRAVTSVNQFDSNRKMVTQLLHASSSDSPHTQLPADLFGINLPAFVTKDGAACHYLQFRQLRQIVYDDLRHPITEIFRIWIAAAIFERQDGYRFDD